jgi:hypothetical protein
MVPCGRRSVGDVAPRRRGRNGPRPVGLEGAEALLLPHPRLVRVGRCPERHQQAAASEPGGDGGDDLSGAHAVWSYLTVAVIASAWAMRVAWTWAARWPDGRRRGLPGLAPQWEQPMKRGQTLSGSVSPPHQGISGGGCFRKGPKWVPLARHLGTLGSCRCLHLALERACRCVRGRAVRARSVLRGLVRDRPDRRAGLRRAFTKRVMTP